MMEEQVDHLAILEEVVAVEQALQEHQVNRNLLAMEGQAVLE
tara:strand:- start:216 stop:341 length:126 start_codon:yes stop_codon:yes gene_type:complete